MEGKFICSSWLERGDLDLCCRKPIEIQEQICFSMSSSGSNALCGSDLGTCSSSQYPISSGSHESTKQSMDCLGKVAHYKSTCEDLFSMHNIGGTFSSSPACSVEPSIGLRLGRPKEYVDSLFPTSSSGKSSVTSFPMKRSRAAYHNLQNPCCQVEGCNLDLKSAKDYHRRHRICENHSKSPKVIVAGMERRFCQQCSRFHELSEFDDKKRSCRRRLSDHNARRRRVQPESFQLISQGPPSAFYGHKLERNLLLNGFPISQTGAADGTLCCSNDEMHNSVSTLHLDSTRNIMDNQSLHIATTDPPMAPDLLGTAPSLLSSNTWTLNESETSHMQGFVHGNYIPTIRHLHPESHPFSLFLPNHSSVSVPISLMNTVTVATDHPLEYQLFNPCNFFSGNP